MENGFLKDFVTGLKMGWLDITRPWVVMVASAFVIIMGGLVVFAMIFPGHKNSSAVMSSTTPPANNRRDAEAKPARFAVKGNVLGDGGASCSALPVEYYSIVDNTLARVQMQCRIGTPKDFIDVTFSADGKQVVEIDRWQAFDDLGDTVQGIFKAAVSHYGKPSEYDEDNWKAQYKDGPNVTLSLRGGLCATGEREFIDRCEKTGATMFFNVHLVDVEAKNAALDAAEQTANRMKKEAIEKQEF